MSVTVRSAAAADLDVLIEFGARMALETEGVTLDPEDHREGVRRCLEDAARGSYFLAEINSAVVGTLMVTREWSDWRSAWMWWIQSVYVSPDARGAGVYRALHADVLDRARDAGDVSGVRLYVEGENHGAQKVYEAVGMSQSHYLLYEVEIPKEVRT